MVKTRLNTRKSARAAAKPKKSIKAQETGDANQSKSAIERCKNWIQQQKKEKLQYEPDEINSEDSDDEARQMRLETIPEQSKKETTITKINFGCEWQRCNRVFETYELFQSHVLTHASTVTTNEEHLYLCDWDLCDFEIENSVVFKRHVGYHTYMTKLKTNGDQLLQKKILPACINDSRRRNCVPDSSEKYLCMWADCNYSFDMIEEYFEHAKLHCIHELELNKLGNRNQTVKCQWISCKRTFNLRLKMTDHMRSHTGERFVACSNCGSTCNSYAKFYDHFRRQALNNNYKCSQCYQSFNTEELLNNHMYAHVNRFKCTMCDMTCPSTAALAQHFRYRHIADRPFKCGSCKYAAVFKWDLDKHVNRMHSVESTTYLCEEFDCEFTCTAANVMRNHVRNVHGEGPNIYCCHCCDRRYKRGSLLSRHLKQMHGFQLPSGHRRFTYHIDIDGVYRVQTTRMESLEVSEQIMAPTIQDPATTRPFTYTLGELNKTENGYRIGVVQIEPPQEEVVIESVVVEEEVSRNDEKEEENRNDEVLEQLDDETHPQNDIRSINSSEFMESLSLKQLPQSKRRHQDLPIFIEEIEVCNENEHKSIDNFSVIQKYAKGKRSQKITTYTIEDVDEYGNVLQTRTRHVDDSDFDSLAMEN